LEVRLEPARIPKRSTLIAVRQRFSTVGAFSVVTSDRALGDDGESALDAALEAAEALEARFVVLHAPQSLRPGTASEKRVLTALGKLATGVGERPTQIVFEPSGLWQRSRVRSLCAETGALFAQQPDELEVQSTLYLRLVQLGTGRARLSRQLDAIAETIAGCEEAWVVVVGGGTPTVERALIDAVSAYEEEFGDDESGEGED
jgi:hypothetical protein